MDFHEDIQGGIKEQWVGYAVIAYDNPQRQRVIEQWDLKDPFDSSNSKPQKQDKWHLNLRSTETGDGKMFPAKYIPRKLPKDEDDGLESEIRMHQATSGDTEMKFCYVYEINPPTV